MLREYIISLINKVDIFADLEVSPQSGNCLIWYDGPMCFILHHGGFTMIFSVCDEIEVEPRKWLTFYEIFDVSHIDKSEYVNITKINSGVKPSVTVVVDCNDKNESIIIDYIEFLT